MTFKIGDRIFVRGYIDEIRKDTVIVRNDGGYFGTILSEVTGELPSAQAEPCEDTVSRQKLLSDLKELVAAWKKYPAMAKEIKGVETAIGYVEAIPPAQQERKGKKGKWIPVTNGRGGFECNQCHCYAPSYQDGVEWLSAFCPNCGARMVKESEEHDES